MKTTGTSPDIDILYEDNHLLVVHKPPGVLSQEDHTGRADMLTLCKAYLKREYNKPGNVFLGLVHRLDKPVSGVMVFAKTSKAASRISEQIRNRRVKKEYLAVVDDIPPSSGMLSDYLLKDTKKNRTKVVSANSGGAKLAELTFKRINQKESLALLSVNLITGRPHQIRVQLANMGHPVLGDSKYGSGTDSPLALHAREMTLEHPTQKKEVTFRCNPPSVCPWDHFGF